MSIGADILTALKERLDTVKIANGYDLDIATVRLDKSEPTLNTPSNELPLVEIINESEKYIHGASSLYECVTSVILYMVAEKAWTDSQMEDFKSNIRRALFGGAPHAGANNGVTLNGKVTRIALVDSKSDLNMIDANRIYLMTITLHSHRRTYED